MIFFVCVCMCVCVLSVCVFSLVFYYSSSLFSALVANKSVYFGGNGALIDDDFHLSPPLTLWFLETNLGKYMLQHFH